MSPARTMPRINVPILVMSLVSAIVLRAVVTSQETPTIREVRIGLKYTNIPSRLVPISPQTETLVKVNGPAEVVEKLPDGAESGTVNLESAKEGKHEYIIGLPYDLQRIALVEFPKIPVTIEPVIEDDYPVQTGTSGRLADPTKLLENRDVLPHVVKVSGPRSAMKQVAQVRLTIDLSKVDPNAPDPYEGYLRLYDVRNNELDQTALGLSIDPPNGTVHLGFVTAPVQKAAFVIVNFAGHPNQGYKIDGNYTTTPDRVTITGTSLAVARTGQVQTEPVDITGLTASHQFTVKIILPPGVTAANPNEVKVRVPIARIP